MEHPAGSIVASHKHAADYTPEEVQHLEQAFAPLAKRYRRRRKIVWSLLAAALVAFVWFLIGLAPWRTRGHLSPWKEGVTGALMILGFGMFFTVPRLVCPGRIHCLDFGLEIYCPECGSNQLKPRRISKGARSMKTRDCGNCYRHLTVAFSRRERGRYFAIRFCTYCGLLLDRKGGVGWR